MGIPVAWPVAWQGPLHLSHCLIERSSQLHSNLHAAGSKLGLTAANGGWLTAGKRPWGGQAWACELPAAAAVCFGSFSSWFASAGNPVGVLSLIVTHCTADVVVSILLEVQGDQSLGLCLEEILHVLLVPEAVGAAVIHIQHHCSAQTPDNAQAPSLQHRALTSSRSCCCAKLGYQARPGRCQQQLPAHAWPTIHSCQLGYHGVCQP